MYTKHYSWDPPMRDYPWANDIPLTDEQKEITIPIEVSLWGVLALALFVATKIGALAMMASAGNFELTMIGFNEYNPNEVYKTDVTWYTA